MAHVAKYNKGAMGHMLSHYDRSKNNLGGNIDAEKTCLNYNLADHQNMSQLEFIHQRLSQVKVQNRKDLNVLCDWVVTAPKDLPEREYKAFFEASYDFLKKRYGLENVVSAYVHMDEVTPHMHFAFIPVVRIFKQDRKNPNISTEVNKVSAKECINRYDLQGFHESLQRHVSKALGHEVGILNEATKEGNKSIAELKRQSAAERLHEASLEASRIVSKAQKDILPIEERKAALESELEGLKRDLLTTQQVKDVPHTKALIGDKQVVSTEDFNALCRTAATAESLLKEIVPARKINARAKEIISQAQEKAAEIIAQSKQESIQTVIERAKRVSELENKLNMANEHLRATLSLLSEKAGREFVSAWNQTKTSMQEHIKNVPDRDQER